MVEIMVFNSWQQLLYGISDLLTHTVHAIVYNSQVSDSSIFSLTVVVIIFSLIVIFRLIVIVIIFRLINIIAIIVDFSFIFGLIR